MMIGAQRPASEYDPFDHAARLGLRVIRHEIAAGENGRYYDRSRLIVLRPAMSVALERCVLAHELGHAHHKHTESTEETEMLADVYAGRKLISKTSLLRALAESDDRDALCRKFGVTRRLLSARLFDLGVIPAADVLAWGAP